MFLFYLRPFILFPVPGTYKIKEGVSVCFQPRRDKIPPVTKGISNLLTCLNKQELLFETRSEHFIEEITKMKVADTLEWRIKCKEIRVLDRPLGTPFSIPYSSCSL